MSNYLLSFDDYKLFEANTFKLKDVKSKFLDTKKISRIEFDYIVGSDPSDNKIYAYWVINNHLNNKTPVNILLDQINWHNTFKSELDVKYKNIYNLESSDILKLSNDPKFKLKSDIKNVIKSSNSHKINKNKFTSSNKVYKGIRYSYTDNYFKPGMKILSGIKIPLGESLYSENIETVKKDYYYATK